MGFQYITGAQYMAPPLSLKYLFLNYFFWQKRNPAGQSGGRIARGFGPIGAGAPLLTSWTR
jgi:hypothetical protein